MAEEGIEFVVSTEIGNDLPAKQLIEEFDSVVLVLWGDQTTRSTCRGQGT